MMHLWLPMVLAAVLAGAGTYGVLARRNAVLVLIGVELILNAANLMLVALGSRDGSPLQAGQSLTLFVITIAAAEICVALAVVLAMFRLQGHVDLTRVPATEDGGVGHEALGHEAPGHEAPGKKARGHAVRG